MRIFGVGFWALPLFLLSISAFAASTVYDITHLVGRSQKIQLLGNLSVSLAEANSADSNTRILFEDLMPGANWDHPAAIKVVNSNGKVLQSIKTKRPPVGLSNAPLVSGPATRGSEVTFNISDLDGKRKIEAPENHFALLINGQADRRHWNDFSFLYRVLVKVYGYKPENITVVDGNFEKSSPDLDDDGKPDIQYKSDIAGVRKAMTDLKEKLKPEHQLLLAVNDHGSQEDGESTLVLQDGDMKVSEFKTLFHALPANRILSIHEQCFSGGFVRPTVADEKVTMAASTDNEFSWASMDLNFDEFIYHVITAFGGQTHEGKKVNADYNKDGKISAKEAFAYATAKDQRPESPVLESHVNTGDAAAIGIGF